MLKKAVFFVSLFLILGAINCFADTGLYEDIIQGSKQVRYYSGISQFDYKSWHYIYVAKQNNLEFVVYDDIEQEKFDAIQSVYLSPNGESFSYTGKKEDKLYTFYSWQRKEYQESYKEPIFWLIL